MEYVNLSAILSNVTNRLTVCSEALAHVASGQECIGDDVVDSLISIKGVVDECNRDLSELI